MSEDPKPENTARDGAEDLAGDDLPLEDVAEVETPAASPSPQSTSAGNASASEPPAIEIESLTRVFGDQIAVDDLNLTIGRGEIFGYIGPNGAGKTTTIRILAGLLKPTRGTARVLGINVRRWPRRVKELVGYMPDSFGVYDNMTLGEYLDFFAAAHRIRRGDRRRVIPDVLALTDLTEKKDDQVSAFSKGMKQRACLAKTLLHDPQVLILDEPAAGLDPRARIEFRELLRELKRMGKTILVSSHILAELSAVCDTVGIIEQGKLVASGPVETILRSLRSHREFTLKLLHTRDAARAQDLLREQSCVQSVEEVGGALRLEIEATEKEISGLVEALGKTGIAFTEFREEVVDLETAFMTLTQGKLAYGVATVNWRIRMPFLEFPLLRRELVGTLRTRRAFYLLVTVVTLASVMPLFQWPSAGEFSDPERNIQRFSMFAFTQLIVALLIVPAFTATAFTTEREENTFEMLFTTLLPRWSIVVSKLLSSMGYVLLLLAASAPSLCTLYLLGGLGFGMIVECYGITLAALVMSALVCLRSSLRARSTAGAVVRSYVELVAWNGGLALVIFLALMAVFRSALRGGAEPAWFIFLAGMNPFVPTTVLVFEELSLNSLPWSWGPVEVFYIYAGAVAGTNLLLLLWKARSPYTLAAARLGWRRRRQRRAKPLRRTRFTQLLIRAGESGVPVVRNPLFQKELRSEFFSRVRYRWLAFWLPFLVGALILVAVEPRDDDWLEGVMQTTLFFVLLVVPAVSATGITRETELGNLDFLRSTRLTMGEIVRGKYLSALFANIGLLAAPVWVFVISLPFGIPHRGDWSQYHWIMTAVSGWTILALTYAFAAAIGLLATVLVRRSIAALLISYVVLLALTLGYPLLGEFFDLNYQFWRDNESAATHPFVAMERAVGYYGYGAERNLHRGFREVAKWFVLYYGAATALLVAGACIIANRRLAQES